MVSSSHIAAPSHKFHMPLDRLVSVALFGCWQYQDESLDASESSMSCCEDKLPSNAVYCTDSVQYVCCFVLLVVWAIIVSHCREAPPIVIRFIHEKSSGTTPSIEPLTKTRHIYTVQSY